MKSRDAWYDLSLVSGDLTLFCPTVPQPLEYHLMTQNNCKSSRLQPHTPRRMRNKRAYPFKELSWKYQLTKLCLHILYQNPVTWSLIAAGKSGKYRSVLVGLSVTPKQNHGSGIKEKGETRQPAASAIQVTKQRNIILSATNTAFSRLSFYLI